MWYIHFIRMVTAERFLFQPRLDCQSQCGHELDSILVGPLQSGHSVILGQVRGKGVLNNQSTWIYKKRWDTQPSVAFQHKMRIWLSWVTVIPLNPEELLQSNWANPVGYSQLCRMQFFYHITILCPSWAIFPVNSAPRSLLPAGSCCASPPRRSPNPAGCSGNCGKGFNRASLLWRGVHPDKINVIKKKNKGFSST